jgi:hypothetical protein
MKSIQINFFATRADLVPGLEQVESEHSLQYVLSGMFECSTPQRFSSAFAIADLGIAHSGHYIAEKAYLVAEADLEIATVAIPQTSGGVLYEIDLRTNPRAFIFSPGGQFGRNTIISGRLGTATGDVKSLAACRMFADALMKGFTKLHRHYLGPAAVQLLDQGGRLTASIQSPPDFDFRR